VCAPRQKLLQTQPNDTRFASRQLHPVIHRRFGSHSLRIDCPRISPNDRLVKRIFHERQLVWRSVEQLQVGLVVGKEELLRASGAAFAYSIVISKKRSSRSTPVSQSSNSARVWNARRCA
jgi:hypothetical protein